MTPVLAEAEKMALGYQQQLLCTWSHIDYVGLQDPHQKIVSTAHRLKTWCHMYSLLCGCSGNALSNFGDWICTWINNLCLSPNYNYLNTIIKHLSPKWFIQ